MSAESRFVRTKKGTVIHRADCGLRGRDAVPWRWADAVSDSDIRSVIVMHEYKVCRICKPLVMTGGDR